MSFFFQLYDPTDATNISFYSAEKILVKQHQPSQSASMEGQNSANEGLR